MKTLAATFALFISLLGSTAFAQDQLATTKAAATHIISDDAIITPPAAYYRSFQAAVFPRNNGNIAVHVEKALHEEVKVNIYNSKGELVSKDKLKKHHLFNKQYQMKRMPKDTYTFEIISQNKVYKKQIQVN